ncbi:hypothetical protein [Bradyrhizobium sp. STM 3843]|uniref:hypothetical protein n=1 Tax=Bradyrhizobium sp. STM 3843 TaxID=551947 RepID=UPI0011126CB1|nr:hypothetical protein [Bradyrhizobium sp. STM 3843]
MPASDDDVVFVPMPRVRCPSRRCGSRFANRSCAIRKKATFDEPWIKSGSSARPYQRKFFSLPKFPDSVFGRGFLRLSLLIATPLRAVSPLQQGLQKMPAVKAFPALFISSMILHSRAARVVARVARPLVSRTASRARAFACQHFLKPEAVFFFALVYSGRSASRFPSARSD